MTGKNSALRRQQLANTLSDRLSTLWGIVRSRNQRGLTDVNHALERIIMVVMNTLFDWDLLDLNAAHLNYPAADLGDIKRRKAVQVTSNSGSAKVKHTYETALSCKLHHDFDDLYVFVLSPTKSKIKLTLDTNALALHVWNIADLVAEAIRRNVGVQALLDAIECLDAEIAPADEWQKPGLGKKHDPVALARFQLDDGKPIPYEGDDGCSYALELWFEGVPDPTSQVTIELLDRTVEDSIWTVKRKKGTRVF